MSALHEPAYFVAHSMPHIFLTMARGAGATHVLWTLQALRAGKSVDLKAELKAGAAGTIELKAKNKTMLRTKAGGKRGRTIAGALALNESRPLVSQLASALHSQCARQPWP